MVILKWSIPALSPAAYVATVPTTDTEPNSPVLSDSGASQPVVDDHDKRIIQETLNGTATYKGSKTGKPGLIDNEADVGGLEDFPTTTRPTNWDANDDGIADWWDGSTGGDGYTAIEGYINFLADPHVFVAPGASIEYNLASLAGGFSNPVSSDSRREAERDEHIDIIFSTIQLHMERLLHPAEQPST